jgi:hypothetical protein
VGARGRRPLWSPCVKSRSQNWDPTSWKWRPKGFQVSVLETASVKIQAPKLRSQVLKTMSWNHILKFPRPQRWDPKSWKPCPENHILKFPRPQRVPGWSVASRGYSQAPATPTFPGPCPQSYWVEDHSKMVRTEMVRTERNCIIDGR